MTFRPVRTFALQDCEGEFVFFTRKTVTFSRQRCKASRAYPGSLVLPVHARTPRVQPEPRQTK